jgi:aminoglycoside phosphotransferase (APT) family kinase protein
VVPEPLAVVPSLRLGLAEEVPGRPALPDLVKAACVAGAPPSASPALREAVVTAARALAAVHLCDPSGSPLPVRDARGERAAAARDVALLEPVWPEVAERLRGALTPALEGPRRQGPLTEAAATAPVLAHGDFTPGQVLLDGSGRAGLVDVDTLCLAEPALDLGRFLAYLHVLAVRRSRRAQPLLAELTAVFLDAYLDTCLDARAQDHRDVPGADHRRLLRDRAAAYRAWALARIGARACWQLKDGRLRAVVDLLDAGDEWMRGGAG